jgi:hypothetical protein
MPTMTSPSSRGQKHRLKLRVPWLLEVEGEGVPAVLGGVVLAALVIAALAAYRLIQ